MTPTPSQPGSDDQYYNVVRVTVLFLFMLTFYVLLCLRFFAHGETRLEDEEMPTEPRRGEARSGPSYDSFKDAPPLDDYFAPAQGRGKGGVKRADPAVVVSAVPCIQTGLVPTSTSTSWPDARRSGGWWARRESYPTADF